MERANDMCFSGKILTLNEIENNYFGGAMTIAGSSRRNNCNYEKECRIGFMVPKSIWNDLILKTEIGNEIEVAGHFEMWVKERAEDKQKVKLIHVVDQLISA